VSVALSVLILSIINITVVKLGMTESVSLVFVVIPSVELVTCLSHINYVRSATSNFCAITVSFLNRSLTRQLRYRKEDRAMRAIYWVH